MGIFARLAALLKSNLNDLISSSEDPEKMLNQIVLDMSNQLLEAKRQVAASIADEKRLAKQVEQETANASEWERRAMLAVRAGDDALAKEALSRKKEHQTLAEQFQDQWSKQKQAVDQLKLALRALNNKIEEAKRKKSLLIARKKRAEAQKAIQETMTGLKNARAFEVTKGADEDLLSLKRKMGLIPAEPEPPKASPVRVEQVASESMPLNAAEQDELARALADLEAEEQQQLRMKK